VAVAVRGDLVAPGRDLAHQRRLAPRRLADDEEGAAGVPVLVQEI
jgi:hypothetical protein